MKRFIENIVFDIVRYGVINVKFKNYHQIYELKCDYFVIFYCIKKSK